MRASLQYLALGSTLLFAAPNLYAEVVNLNKADAETLQRHLQGIGPVKSQAIVDYRKKHGPYKSLDDLLKVEGIGPKLLEKNKKKLSLSRGVSQTEKRAKHTQRKQTDRSADAEKSSRATPSGDSIKGTDVKKSSKELHKSTESGKEKYKSSTTSTKKKNPPEKKHSSASKKSSKTKHSENNKKSSSSKK